MVYGFQDTNYSGQHKICQSKQYLSTEEHTENELPTVKILIRLLEFMSIGVLLSNVPFLNSSKRSANVRFSQALFTPYQSLMILQPLRSLYDCKRLPVLMVSGRFRPWSIATPQKEFFFFFQIKKFGAVDFSGGGGGGGGMSIY